MRAMGGAIVAAAAAALAACGTTMQRTALIDSTYLSAEPEKKEAMRGVPYFLPSTVLPIRITGEFKVIRKEETNPQAKDYDYLLSMSILPTKQVPDTSAQMLLEYLPEIASDDEFTISVTEDGLLSNLKAKSTDRSKDVVLKLVELAAQVFKAVAAGDEAPEDKRRETCYAMLQPVSIDWPINISNVLSNNLVAENRIKDENRSIEISTDELSNALLDAMTRGAVERCKRVKTENPLFMRCERVKTDKPPTMPITMKMAGTRTSADREYRDKIAMSGETGSGVLFRAMTSRVVTATLDTDDLAFVDASAPESRDTCTLASGAQIARTQVMAAHPAQTFMIDTSRTALVKKRVDLTIRDGVLIGTEVDKPSELLAGVSLPVEVLKAIVSIPAELLTFKINEMKAETGLTTEEVNALKAEIELLKQQQALEALKQEIENGRQTSQ